MTAINTHHMRRSVCLLGTTCSLLLSIACSTDPNTSSAATSAAGSNGVTTGVPGSDMTQSGLLPNSPTGDTPLNGDPSCDPMQSDCAEDPSDTTDPADPPGNDDALVGPSGPPYEYHVSAKGALNGTGTEANPFPTIQHCADIMLAGDTCLIHEGFYRETVIPRNSGESDKPIVFKAADAGKVVISGADIVEGQWTQYRDNIYQTPISWTMGRGRDFLFLDGQPLVQARHPNTPTAGKQMPPTTYELSEFFPHQFGPFNVTLGSPQITNDVDLNQDQPDYWKGATYLGMHGWSWCMQNAIVESSSRGQITVRDQAAWWFPDDANIESYAYQWAHVQWGYLTDHLNALDMAGEWHIENGTLYLWTPDSSNPQDHVVEVKRRDLAFDLRNKDYIRVEGFKVISASANLYNSNYNVLDDNRFSYVSHFLQFKSAIDNIDQASAALDGKTGIIVGGEGNEITNSIIEYSAGAGLILQGHNTTVSNNVIRDIGYVTTYLSNIYLSSFDSAGPIGGHKIHNNNLFNSGRSAILSVNSQLPYEAMEINNNRIHDGCILGNDCGVLYLYDEDMGTAEQESQVHHNLFWDQWSDFWSSLFFTDQRAYFVAGHHNVLWYSTGNPFSVNDQAHHKVHVPREMTYYENNHLGRRDGGPAALNTSDYPGGYFETGSTLMGKLDEPLIPAGMKIE